VASGDSDDIDISGSHAFLYGSGSDMGGFQLFLLQEIWLELHHAGTGDEHGWVVWDERRRRPAPAALRFEEFQVFFTEIATFHCRLFRSWLCLGSQLAFLRPSLRLAFLRPSLRLAFLRPSLRLAFLRPNQQLAFL